jgi:NADPH-dependent 2,4-dienoyl-CoA reductase/sulfur reductase-like enzyme
VRQVQGLHEAVLDPACPVATIYDYNTAEKVDSIMKNVKQGEVLFTQPACPIKCGGAPQKVMWLQEAAFRQRGLRDQITVNFFTNLPAMFAVKKYGDVLDKMAEEKDIKVHHTTDLVKIDKDRRVATFRNLKTMEETTKKFDAMHVTPYMSPPDAIKNSPLADKTGFIDINKETLQHTKYPNVFALGDCSNLPTSKTAAAIGSQAPVLVSNLVHQMKGEELTAKYNGYTSCPIFVGNGKLVLAEFLYGGVVDETFPWDQVHIPYTLHPSASVQSQRKNANLRVSRRGCHITWCG